MREFTQIEKYRVEIRRRAFQRSVNLTVRPDGGLRVTCGKRISQKQIARFVCECEPFIQKRLSEMSEKRAQHPPRQMVSGEEFLFFGEKWRLELVWTWNSKPRIKVGEKIFEMLAPVESSVEERRKALRRFYKRQGEFHLRERAHLLAEKMGLHPRAIAIRGQRTRWGSCSAEGAINLNWKLLAAPVDVIDYVIVHELAHIRHLNHSAEFWQLVGQFFPEWKNAKSWLKDHEFAISMQFHMEHSE